MIFSIIHNRKELDLLGEKLEQAARVQRGFGVARKNVLKKRVMQRLDEAIMQEEIGFEQLAEQLERLTLTVEPTKTFKIHARESLIDMLSLRDQRVWVKDLFRDVLAQRRLWATVMATVVLSVGTFGYMTQLPQVSAAKVSFVDSFQGAVTIDRDGEELVVFDGFAIQEGDLIHTGGNGWANLVFVDDSSLTIGPETDVSISRLWIDPNNDASTSVEVAVVEGRLWAHVVRLLDDSSSFTLSSDRAQFTVDHNATFDLWVTDDSLEFRVFDQLVDFQLMSDEGFQRGTLGQNLLMRFDEAGIATEKLEDMDSLKMSDVWIQTNVDNNEKHVIDVENYYAEQLEQKAGTLPGDPFYFFERGAEEVRLFFSLDDEFRSDLTLDLADQRLSEAMVLIGNGEEEVVGDMLEDYQEALVGFVEETQDYEEVQALLDESKKTLGDVLPLDELYEVREVVEATAVLLASDDSTRAQLQLETAANRLGLALELIQIGAYDLAQASLQDYQQGLTELLDNLQDFEMEERREVVMGILDQKLDDLKWLKLITGELNELVNGEEAASFEVQEQLADVYDDTLYQLNTMVLNLKERAVLHLTTFLGDVKGDDEVQLQILNRLKKSVELEFEFMELINDLESLYGDSSDELLVVDESFADSEEDDAELSLEDYLDDQVEETSVPQDLEVGLL